MSKNYHIAVLPGDGIGPEVMNRDESTGSRAPTFCHAHYHQPV